MEKERTVCENAISGLFSTRGPHRETTVRAFASLRQYIRDQTSKRVGKYVSYYDRTNFLTVSLGPKLEQLPGTSRRRFLSGCSRSLGFSHPRSTNAGEHEPGRRIDVIVNSVRCETGWNLRGANFTWLRDQRRVRCARWLSDFNHRMVELKGEIE